MYAVYAVSVSNLTVTVSTTIRVEDYDPSEVEDVVIDLGCERIDEELGVPFSDSCHSVHMELISENYG